MLLQAAHAEYLRRGLFALQKRHLLNQDELDTLLEQTHNNLPLFCAGLICLAKSSRQYRAFKSIYSTIDHNPYLVMTWISQQDGARFDNEYPYLQDYKSVLNLGIALSSTKDRDHGLLAILRQSHLLASILQYVATNASSQDMSILFYSIMDKLSFNKSREGCAKEPRDKSQNSHDANQIIRYGSNQ